MIQNNCAMRKLNVHFVSMAAMPLWARLECCGWRARKRPHTGGENYNTSKLSTKGNKVLLTRGRIMLWILIFTLSLWYHLSSQLFKEKN